jgi:hypothetical protein
MAMRYRNLSLLFAGLALACFVFASVGSWASELLLYGGAFLALPSCVYFLRRSGSWSAGAKGEEEVARALESLRGCHVLHDIMLPGGWGNIDHFVAASNGVFVIETKNYTGAIRCTGGLWEVRRHKGRGRPYIKMRGNPSAQARRNAAMLSRHISARTDLDLYVNAIVCFPNPQCELKVYSTTIPVVRLDGLRNAILGHSSTRTLSNEDAIRIRNELRKYASSAAGS